MDNIRTLQGDLLARDLRFAIVAARFNDAIVENLVRGAVDTLLRHGASEKQIEIIRVPGAFDLPFIARRVAHGQALPTRSSRSAAVIRGATPHFDSSRASARRASRARPTTPAFRSRSAC